MDGNYGHFSGFGQDEMEIINDFDSKILNY